MEYRHTQIGVVIIASMVAAIVLVFAPFLTAGMFHPVQIAVLAILVVALALFYSLSVEIKDKVLTCSFGAGIIRKKIPLAEIHQARAVENPWYAGWGIRWMAGQYWMWNVSGLRAVELTLKDGKRFQIGTDEPESLVRAIESNKAMGA